MFWLRNKKVIFCYALLTKGLLWKDLISMDDNGLTKCLFNVDYTATGNTWCSDLKSLLHQVKMQQTVDLECVKVYLTICTNKNGMKNCILYQNSEPM